MKKINTLVITGGHHNSALVVAQKLISQGHLVYWFGHRLAAINDQNDSAEYQEVKAAGISFYELKAGKFGEGGTLFSPLHTIMGVIRACNLLKDLKPKAVISFGGYLGFATGIAAVFCRIPLFLHEQTVVAGKSNQLLAYFARRIYLTWGSSLAYFPRWAKIKIVGLPLRSGIIKKSHHKLFANGKPTLLLLGGKQGSHALNVMIANHLPQLLARYNLIHQTGTNSCYQDYARAQKHKLQLPEELASSYIVKSYLTERELAKVLGSIDIYIGRSGAHITYELGFLGIRSILIPYLHTHKKEQLKNAELLKNNNLAYILLESELNFPRLRETIAKLLKQKSPTPLPLPQNAADTMVADLVATLGV